MSVSLINPEGVARVNVHHQVTVATGSRIINMAGQVSWDANAQLVGAGDLIAQTEQAYLNVAACLRGAGATTADLTGAVLYIVDLDRARLEQVSQGIRRASERLGVSFQHPGTYIGVTSLFDPNYLIEIVGTTVID